ncbi:MAG: cysteine desulfurase family protein [Bacilli bacterium]|nr:cysteine desulfurase family protein [Bacilli bacterium]
MIYLDYSATTPVNIKVLKYFEDVSLRYIGNANSIHSLGKNSFKAINSCSKKISSLLKLKDQEIIYTSGATESNNLAIKGIAFKYANQSKQIITTYYEHSSIIASINYMRTLGFKVQIVNSNNKGIVDLEHLKKLINDDTVLVSIGSVNSEIGIRQPINEINKIVKQHKNCIFHCDMTQSIGKERIDLSQIDLISFSAHKFYGIKGVGALIKKNNLQLDPQIHGGKSTTIYRSGTPATPLILSMGKALELMYVNFDKKYNHVAMINKYLRGELEKIKEIKINSTIECLPHILNISIPSFSSKKMVKELAKNDIYISNHTACSSDESKSLAIYALTNDLKLARTSIRISLSYLTTKKEINMLVEQIKRMLKNV